MLVLGVLAAAGAAGAQQSTVSAGPTLFFDGTFELTGLAGGGDPHPVDDMIRGDDPFDPLRLRLFLDVVLTPHLTLFNQLLLDPSIDYEPNSFLRSYLRYTLLDGEHARAHLQAGKIPSPFGAWAPKSYSDRNPLIGTPLVYQYFTSLRANQLPADNAELLAHRGQGQGRDFGGFVGGGSPAAINGLPIVYDACWDTGIEAIGAWEHLEGTLAVTRGTLSTPEWNGDDHNGGSQWATHLAYTLRPGVTLGASWARGPYLREEVAATLAASGLALDDYAQEAWGVDLALSAGHWQLAAEGVRNRWQAPTIHDAAGRPEDLATWGGYLESRYTFLPGAWIAARYGRIDFGRIDDGTGSGRRSPWDAPVRRLEAGLGYYLTDRVITKLVWQQTERQAPARLHDGFLALQLSASF